MARLHEFPEPGDLVVCTVKNVRNFGGFVSLEEYDQKEGFIHITEIATGWVKRMSDFVREGQRVVCRVIEVNPSKGHIDLSLKKVNEHQKRETIQDWKNEQRAEKLLEIVGEKLGKDGNWCYETFANKLIEHFDSLYIAFEEAASNDKVDKKLFKGDWVEAFKEVAVDNVTPAMVSIDGFLELTSNAPDGIEHIRKALLKAEESKEVEIEVQYVGAPKYRIVVKAVDYKTAEEELKMAVDRASGLIEKAGGTAKFNRREK